ncbi:hypothetical protein AYI68_g2991 [Smittium mucronatum]|uniref:Hexosyltransferase n=1 Tax=Smittium mucronatum TaxID=133383 RepID=A0A1R0H163_9FUNG|nr:hypothetical protein AYI68_g2991 [Smittium mucronatum]
MKAYNSKHPSSNSASFSSSIFRSPHFSKSWKVADKDMRRLMYYDFESRSDVLKLPREYYGPAKIIDLYDQYQIIIPISKYESISYLKNFYSDMNILTFCDFDDDRPECDIRSHQNYDYIHLSNKTLDMFDFACKNLPGYKFYAKMDFDTYVDKSYLSGVIKFIADNADKNIYYGNPILRHGRVFNGGNFYALSGSLFRDYCSCNIHLPKNYNEDEWFGDVLNRCFYSKNPHGTNLYYMYNDMNKILHKSFTDGGVSITLGNQTRVYV